MFGKLATRARARGIGEVAAHLAGLLREAIVSGDTLIVLVRSTGDHDVGAGVDPRRATAADGRRYARDIGTDSARTFARRLSRNDCYLVERDGVIVHATWVTTHSVWTREIRRFFTPPVGDVYVYESYTRPEARGQGIYPALLRALAERLGRSGTSRMWIAVGATNVSSHKAITKAGFAEACHIDFSRRLGRLDLGRPMGAEAGDCLARLTTRSG